MTLYSHIQPYTSIQIPWYIAKAIKAAFSPLIIALEVQGVYFKTWAEVYRG